jgi:hypothetical protein
MQIVFFFKSNIATQQLLTYAMQYTELTEIFGINVIVSHQHFLGDE